MILRSSSIEALELANRSPRACQSKPSIRQLAKKGQGAWSRSAEGRLLPEGRKKGHSK